MMTVAIGTMSVQTQAEARGGEPGPQVSDRECPDQPGTGARRGLAGLLQMIHLPQFVRGQAVPPVSVHPLGRGYRPGSDATGRSALAREPDHRLGLTPRVPPLPASGWHTVPSAGIVPSRKYASTALSIQLDPDVYAVCPSPS